MRNFTQALCFAFWLAMALSTVFWLVGNVELELGLMVVTNE